MIFPPSGRAIEAPFARLFGQLACDGFTGTLQMADGDRHYSLGWRAGQVVEGQSASPEDTFGRIALEAGVCSAAQVGESVHRLAQTPGRRQPAILIEMGALDPIAAERVARMALSRRARRVFAFPNATYTISAQSPAAEEGGPLEPRWVLLRGVRKYYSDQRLENELGGLVGTAVRLSVEPALLEAYAFPEEDRNIITYLGKGFWEAADLVAACDPIPRSQVLSALLALFAFEAIEVVPAASVPRLRKRGRTASAPLPPPVISPPPSRHPIGPTPVPAPPHIPPSVARSIQPPGSVRTTGSYTVTPVPVTNRPGTAPVPVTNRPGTTPVPVTNRPGTTPVPVTNRPGSHPSVRQPSGINPPGRQPSAIHPPVQSLREQIIAKQAQVDGGADYFAVLEVEQNANTEAVKGAYFRLAKTYHPDRLVLVQLDELRPQVEQIFACLGEAYNVLSDETKRRDYLQRAEAPQNMEATTAAHRAISAEEHFRKGEMALRRQQFALAIDEFKLAIELRPDEADHHALLGWAIFSSDPDKDKVYTDARKHILRALELDQACVQGHFYLGQLYKHHGEIERAASHFQRVLDTNERHLEAARELRLIHMRKDSKPKGLFDRFKKK